MKNGSKVGPNPTCFVIIAIIAIVFVMIVFVVGCFMYMGSVMWNSPFRVAGSYENGATHGSLSVSPDGAAIVYESSQTGHGDIYLVNNDGTNVRRLTHD